MAILDLVALAAATGEARYLDLAGQGARRLQPDAGPVPGGAPPDARRPARIPRRPSRPAPATDDPDPTPAPDPLPGGQAVVAARPASARRRRSPRGASFDAVVTLAIKDGWHVYANPTGVEKLKPTTVSVPDGQPASLVEVEYPKGRRPCLVARRRRQGVGLRGQGQATAPSGSTPGRRPGSFDLNQARLPGLQRPASASPPRA